MALFFAVTFAELIYKIHLYTKYKHFVAKNIRKTMKVVSEKSALIIERDHFSFFMKNLTDFILTKKMIQKNKLKKIVSLKNEEILIEALEKKRGIILVSAHLGCWELIGMSISKLLSKKVSVIIQKPSNNIIDQIFNEYRHYSGVKTIYNNLGPKTLKNILESLNKNDCIGFVVDQHGESEKVFGKFFGKYVSIPSGPAFFAYKTRAPIIPVFIRRSKNSEEHIIEFLPEIIMNYENDKNKEINNVSQKIYLEIQKRIMNQPEEWLWVYERFNKLSSEAEELIELM